MFVGNRTDGSSACGIGDQRGPGNNCPHPHPHPGVLIEDIADPANPHVVGDIGPPLEGNPGITSRELRGWPRAELLTVMNFRYSSVIHAALPGLQRAGAALWVGTWVSRGYLAGSHIGTIYHYITQYSTYVLIALAVLLEDYMAWRRTAPQAPCQAGPRAGQRPAA